MNEFKTKKRLLKCFTLTLLFIFTSFTSVWAQQKEISGTVTDAQTKEPLIGVSIAVKGTTNGTMTDIDGNFSLNQVPVGSTLVVSYVGFNTQEIAVSNSTGVLNIALAENQQMLDEVVVVGFGTQKKVNLTGSVGVATSKDLQERPVMLATQALQGLVPGLNISQSNGSLESRASINVRGTGTIGQGSSGSPLVLIDGMEADINAINPQDIENISVLKDAAASSIYGARAPFGVILITTKKGKSGKTTVNYNNSLRWNKPLLLPKAMDSYTFANYYNDASINAGGSAHFGDAWMQNILDYQQGKITTSTVENRNTGRWEEGYDPNGPNNTGGNDNRDYYRELYRSQAFSHEHNVSINGGTDKMTFYTSFNYLDQNGLMRYNQDTYERYTATAKLSFDVSKWVKVNYSNRFARDKYERPSALTNSLYSDIGRQGWPTLPLYDPNGNLLNRWAVALRDQGNDNLVTDNLYQQIQAIFEPIKNWKTFAEYNYSIMNADRHWDKQVTYMHDVNGDPFVWSNSSNVHEDYKKENRMGFNLYSEYSFSLEDKHNFKAMLGIQSEKMSQKLYGMQRDGILVEGMSDLDVTSGTDYYGNPVTPSINGSRARWATFGYFGRINYDYQGRYLAEFNLRHDGASRFRSGSRWVSSPSLSLGWNVAQEKFWEPFQQTVEMLKLRFSYGQLANQNTNGWYPTYGQILTSAAGGAWLIDGKRPATGWTTGSLASDGNLTWEKIRTTNVGLDLSMLTGRFTASFDYFMRSTKDMLGPAPERPATIGVGLPWANNTNLTDKGFELQLSWRDQLPNNFGYGVKFTLSDYRTKIDKYPNTTGDLGTYVAGRYINEIWGYETIGIAKTQEEMDAHLAKVDQSQLGSKWGAGDIMYADLDGDGKVSSGSYTEKDHGDLKVIGNSTPRFQFGLELTADWKGFDLRAFFQGVMKRDYWQGSSFFWGATGGANMWWATGLAEHEDYFRDASTTSVANGALSENLNSYYPRAMFNTDKNAKTQSRYLQDASYIRLKNLQIGYTLPAKLVTKAGLSKLRVFVSGENLWTGTSMSKIFDPETVSGGEGGSVYPLSKVYSVGLSVNF